MKQYTYWDIMDTTAIHRTTRKFIGKTKPMGPLNVPYALFGGKRNELLIPEYLLTPETITALSWYSLPETEV